VPTINHRLSHWDALHFCPCHTWQFQPSPGRSPDGVCWERTDPATGLYIRTWRAKGAGKGRTFEHIGPAQCVTCGWDLTLSPQANIKSMDPREWQQGTIVNTCLSHQGDAADILPGDVEIEFGGCNLDNVVLGAGHTMLGSRKDHRGTTCSHNRIICQNDGRDWLCRWKATAEKAADTPTTPLDLKASLLQGLNVDPALIPAEPPTAKQTEDEDRARQRWEARVANALVYVAEDGWTPCACIAERQAAVETRLGRSVPTAKVMPRRDCPICGGCGALPPAAVKAGG